jgi:hypothetical protein
VLRRQVVARSKPTSLTVRASSGEGSIGAALTSQPVVMLLSQLPKLGRHVSTAHWPAVQVTDATLDRVFAAGQGLLQAPQLVSEVCRST